MFKPKGVIAVLTRSDGFVAAVGTDFGLERRSYNELQDEQQNRAMYDLAVNYVKSYAGEDLAYVMINQGGTVMSSLIRELQNRKGYRVSIECIGYED